jgi:hypothetical protein
MKELHNSRVKDSVTGLEGSVLGPFTRKGERYWTVYWQDGTTTAEREKDIAGE